MHTRTNQQGLSLWGAGLRLLALKVGSPESALGGEAEDRLSGIWGDGKRGQREQAEVGWGPWRYKRNPVPPELKHSGLGKWAAVGRTEGGGGCSQSELGEGDGGPQPEVRGTGGEDGKKATELGPAGGNCELEKPVSSPTTFKNKPSALANLSIMSAISCWLSC